MLVLRLIFALLPIVLLLGALFFARRYPLTPDLHLRLSRLLEKKRCGEPESVGMRAEREILTKALI